MLRNHICINWQNFNCVVTKRKFQDTVRQFIECNMFSTLRVCSTFRTRPHVLFPLESTCNCWSYRQSIRLLGQWISPVRRPLPKQDNTKTDETQTNIYSLSGTLTYGPSVCLALDRAVTVFGHILHISLSIRPTEKTPEFLPQRIFYCWAQELLSVDHIYSNRCYRRFGGMHCLHLQGKKNLSKKQQVECYLRISLLGLQFD
jgi:hypothetical protein